MSNVISSLLNRALKSHCKCLFFKIISKFSVLLKPFNDTVAVQEKIDNYKELSKQLSDTTYALHEAAIAVRGYGMLLDQMGLGKDATEAIHKIEELSMAVLKAVQAYKLLRMAMAAGAFTGDPAGIATLILSGGMAASSAAYDHKMVGGVV